MVTSIARPARPMLAPAPQPVLLTGNRAKDWFENVVRPDRFDPKELEVAAGLRKHILDWQTHDGEFLKNSNFEFAFLAGDHWIEEGEGGSIDLAKDMAAKGRSAFVIDLLTPSVELIVNEVRINKLTANFIPIGGEANTATAEVRQGLYRNIERVSKAAIARETAYQMAVSVGRGYERIRILDEDGATFAKKIAIERVDSLHAVAIDPTCLDFNYADAGWAYTHDDKWPDEFKADFGEDPEGNERDLDLRGDLLDDTARNYWFPNGKIKVGEYFLRKWKRREVWRLEDGTECWKEDAPAESRPIAIKSKTDSYLEWRIMTGTQTMEKRIWPGKLIPIVVFIGREIFRGRKPKIHSGMVKAAMAPSRIHDYMVSRTVDEVALSPLPHMLAPEGSLSPEQQKVVNEINSNTWSVVTYTPKMDDQGRQLQPPAWASPSPNIAAVVQSTAGAKDDLQRVLNTFAPQLGRPSSAESGTAMREVKQQGDASHAAFPDNYNRSLLYEAEVVNELMDVVYTDKQAITITEPDERTKQILINQAYFDERKNKMVTHLFGTGDRYGVSVGKAYPTRGAEAADRLLALAKMFPQMGQALDLILADIDIPNYQKYQDRVRPPGFHADDEEGPSPQEVMQQRDQAVQTLNQAHQMIQQLLQKVNELGDKEATKRMEIASRERIAAASDRTTVVAAEIAAKNLDSHAMLLAELEVILSALEKPATPDQAPDTSTGLQPQAAAKPVAQPGGAQPPQPPGPAVAAAPPEPQQ